jgi:hypothetical protein
VLVLRGHHIPYPPSALGLMRGLGLEASARFAWGLLASRTTKRWETDRANLSDGGDVGFEAFVRARAGDAALQAFYRPYVEKVWGLPGDQLSQTVAKSRLSTASPLAALTRLVSHRRAEFLYPPGGIGTITDYLRQQLEKLEVEIHSDTPYRAEEHEGRTVLFSGNLSDLVDCDLQHRGLYLIYLEIPVPRLSEHDTFYAPESDAWFGRVSELRNFSPALGKPDSTCVVVEIPEGRWGSDQQFNQEPKLSPLLDQLDAAGIVPRRFRPLAVEQHFLPRVYPMYVRGWVDQWRKTLARVAELGNVFPFGRQGLFLHCNIHHCVGMATDLVQQLLSGGDAAEWSRRAAGYLALRVRD